MTQTNSTAALSNDSITPNPWRWPLHILIVMCFLMGFIVRFAWPTLAPVIAPILEFNKTQIGAYMSAFYIGYVLTQIPAGLLADRFGVRLILSGALIVEAISTWFLAGISGYSEGFILRIFAGLGAGMVYAACVRSVVSIFPPKEKNAAFGLLMSAPTVGVLVTNLLVPRLNHAWGWEWSFKIVAIITLIVGLLALIAIKDPKEKSGPQKSFLVGLKYVLGQRSIVFLAFAGFFLLWSMIGYVSFANVYLTDLGLSVESAGGIMIIYGIGGIFGPLLLGAAAAASSSKSHRIFLVLVLVLLAPFLILFSKTTSWAALAVFSSVIGFMIGGANTMLAIMVADYAGREWAGSAGGITGAVFQMGSILSPFVMGKVVDMQNGSYALGWWILAFTAILGALLTLGATKKNAATAA